MLALASLIFSCSGDMLVLPVCVVAVTTPSSPIVYFSIFLAFFLALQL